MLQAVLCLHGKSAAEAAAAAQAAAHDAPEVGPYYTPGECVRLHCYRGTP